jgi:hypothetical protein
MIAPETIAEHRRVSAKQAAASDSDETPSLDLRPQHRARYEEVRRWRREAKVGCVLARTRATSQHRVRASTHPTEII